jgi:hypothetical protein
MKYGRNRGDFDLDDSVQFADESFLEFTEFGRFDSFDDRPSMIMID